jgi:hypothetical protein
MPDIPRDVGNNITTNFLGKVYTGLGCCMLNPRDLKDSEPILPLKNEERGLTSELHCFETFSLQGTKQLIPERMVPKVKGHIFPLWIFSATR